MARERPILFAAPMVRAILAGRKTVTRRALKEQPVAFGRRWEWRGELWTESALMDALATASRWRAGDVLWVRETWRPIPRRDAVGWLVAYGADDAFVAADVAAVPPDWRCPRAALQGRWVPSLHMPRWASRITLEVVGVRVDRGPLSLEEARLEGFDSPGEFAELYAKVNRLTVQRALERWRWRVEFRRLAAEVHHG